MAVWFAPAWFRHLIRTSVSPSAAATHNGPSNALPRFRARNALLLISIQSHSTSFRSDMTAAIFGSVFPFSAGCVDLRLFDRSEFAGGSTQGQKSEGGQKDGQDCSGCQQICFGHHNDVNSGALILGSAGAAQERTRTENSSRGDEHPLHMRGKDKALARVFRR